MPSRSGTFLHRGGLSFVIFTKYKGGVRAIWAVKYQKYVAGKYTHARPPLARKYTNWMFESKDGTTSVKLVNKIERHNFCLNDMLTKSNHTEIQTYKVEEQTFGTPCVLSSNLAAVNWFTNFHKFHHVTGRKIPCNYWTSQLSYLCQKIDFWEVLLESSNWTFPSSVEVLWRY